MNVIKTIQAAFKQPSKAVKPIGKVSNSDYVIINQIAKEFADISRKNIQSWRQAMETANNPETPYWNELQDLYEYLLPDGHLGSQMDIRKGAIESNRFYIRNKKDGKEIPDKTALIQTEWFFTIISHLLDSTFYKYTMLQMVDSETMRFDLVPRRNVCPQKRLILPKVNDPKGISFDDPTIVSTIIYTDSQTKYGILNDIVPDLIWKKNARQAWAEFSEKFGIPLTSATTNSRDQKEISRIEAMMRLLGQSAQAVLPAGTTLTIHDSATKGDPYKVFLEQMNYSDAQISKRILGGTMISDNGSSRSQSEVHERTMNYIIAERERKRIEFTINGQLLPMLAGIGFPFGEEDEFVYDRAEDLTLTQQWAIVKDALQHYDIPDAWVSETFNFPIDGRKQAVILPVNTGEKVTAEARGFFD